MFGLDNLSKYLDRHDMGIQERWPVYSDMGCIVWEGNPKDSLLEYKFSKHNYVEYL